LPTDSPTTECAVEPDREHARRGVAYRGIAAHDAVDHAAQHIGLCEAEACVDHDGAQPAAGGCDHQSERLCGHRLRLAAIVLEQDDRPGAAVAAQVEHDRVELCEVAHDVIDAARPARFEEKAIAVARLRELALDLGALAGQIERPGAARIGRDGQDHRALRARRGRAAPVVPAAARRSGSRIDYAAAAAGRVCGNRGRGGAVDAYAVRDIAVNVELQGVVGRVGARPL